MLGGGHNRQISFSWQVTGHPKLRLACRGRFIRLMALNSLVVASGIARKRDPLRLRFLKADPSRFGGDPDRSASGGNKPVAPRNSQVLPC
jgi:hypothetical protein